MTGNFLYPHLCCCICLFRRLIHM